jgi:hypothetical protein
MGGHLPSGLLWASVLISRRECPNSDNTLTTLSVLGAIVFTALLVALLAEALDARRRRR